TRLRRRRHPDFPPPPSCRETLPCTTRCVVQYDRCSPQARRERRSVSAGQARRLCRSPRLTERKAPTPRYRPPQPLPEAFCARVHASFAMSSSLSFIEREAFSSAAKGAEIDYSLPPLHV